jgi:hypothetical protein
MGVVSKIIYFVKKGKLSSVVTKILIKLMEQKRILVPSKTNTGLRINFNPSLNNYSGSLSLKGHEISINY